MARGFGLVWRRLVQLAPVVAGTTIVTFLLLRLIPGDPAVQMLGTHYTPEAAARLRIQLGLDKPVLEQYVAYIGGLLRGDLGQSIFYRRGVLDLVTSRLLPTLQLIVLTTILATVVAVPVGFIAGIRRGGAFDASTRFLFIIGFSLPTFGLGVLLLLVFGLKLHWFPIHGLGTTLGDQIYHLVLPAATIGIGFATVLIRTLRASVSTILQSDFVETLLAHGVSRRRFYWSHLLPNAVLALIPVFGVNLAFLVSGTVIVENVFGVPGVGALLVEAVSSRDYPVVQAITLIMALLVILSTFLTDVLQIVLDPRIRASVETV
jgi:ABC-type dipeptide/oligopeptide/nickel transport system permease component